MIVQISLSTGKSYTLFTINYTTDGVIYKIVEDDIPRNILSSGLSITVPQEATKIQIVAKAGVCTGFTKILDIVKIVNMTTTTTLPPTTTTTLPPTTTTTLPPTTTTTTTLPPTTTTTTTTTLPPTTTTTTTLPPTTTTTTTLPPTTTTTTTLPPTTTTTTTTTPPSTLVMGSYPEGQGGGTVTFTGGQPNETLNLSFIVTNNDTNFDFLDFSNPITASPIDRNELSGFGTVTLDASGNAMGKYIYSFLEAAFTCAIIISSRDSGQPMPEQDSIFISNS